MFSKYAGLQNSKHWKQIKERENLSSKDIIQLGWVSQERSGLSHHYVSQQATASTGIPSYECAKLNRKYLLNV